MINMKGAIGQAKYTINHRIIAITHYYQIAVGKISYLIRIDTEISSQLANA